MMRVGGCLELTMEIRELDRTYTGLTSERSAWSVLTVLYDTNTIVYPHELMNKDKYKGLKTRGPDSALLCSVLP